MRLCVCILLLPLSVLSTHLQAVPSASIKALAISEQNASVLEHLQDYPDLEVLSMSCLESLKSLPESMNTLRKLRELRIDNGNGCAMNPVLPEFIGNLRSLEKLVLFGAQDPRSVGDEQGPQPGERHKFPQSMSQLKNLTYLDLGRNGFEDVPAFVKDLPNLRELGLGWNELKEVPTFLSNLRDLRTLDLEGNHLDDIPDILNQLPKLSRIKLGNNCKITQSAVKMESLKRRFPKVTFDFTDEYDCPTQ